MIRRDALTFVNDVNAYVFSSVKNRCLDAVKRQAFRQEYFRRTLASTLLDLRMEMIGNHSQVANEVELHEMERRVEQAVNSLPKACRTIFLMSREQGMKYKEISQALNISPNTVECQMVIALMKLRQQLKVSYTYRTGACLQTSFY